MKKRRIIFGIILIVLGIFSLLEALFDINFGRFIFPLILIGIGLLIILKHQLSEPGDDIKMRILGDIHKSGTWEARNHEIWWFVGSTTLDFAEANFPDADAQFKLFAFVNDVKIFLPADVGLRIKSSAFLSEYHSKDKSEERFLGILEEQTDNFLSVEKRVEVLVNGFVADIHVKFI